MCVNCGAAAEWNRHFAVPNMEVHRLPFQNDHPRDLFTKRTPSVRESCPQNLNFSVTGGRLLPRAATGRHEGVRGFRSWAAYPGRYAQHAGRRASQNLRTFSNSGRTHHPKGPPRVFARLRNGLSGVPVSPKQALWSDSREAQTSRNFG